MKVEFGSKFLKILSQIENNHSKWINAELR